jgi:hypothetical protein
MHVWHVHQESEQAFYHLKRARKQGAGAHASKEQVRLAEKLTWYIMTWPAATPMHMYFQVNANKHDSDLPHAQDEHNLAFNKQATQPGTPVGC